MNLCILYGSENKQRLFPYTSLTGWVLKPRCSVFTVRYGLHIYHLKSSGSYMYHQFNIQQFSFLPTQCIYAFSMALRTNSDHFPIQQKLFSVYSRDVVCLLCGMDWIFTILIPFPTICTTSLTLNNSTFCPHSVFLCFVWISEQPRLFPYTALNDRFL